MIKGFSMPGRFYLVLVASVALQLCGNGAWSKADGTVPSADSSRGSFQLHAEHADSLPPMPGDMGIGKEFNPASLMALTPNNRWFPIPEWFAGSWHSESQTMKYLHDYTTGLELGGDRTKPEVGNVVYGTQRDKSGQIWNYIKIPRTEKQTFPEGFAYLQTKREDVVSSGSDQVVIEYLYDQIIVDSGSHIQSVKQVQAFNTYTPLEDGVVRLEASLKSFGPEGQAQIEQLGEKLLTRTAPFAAKDMDGTTNLKALFAEYLKSQGKENLLP